MRRFEFALVVVVLVTAMGASLAGEPTSAPELMRILDESFDLTEFQNPMTLKEVFGLFHEKFKERGLKCAILVDIEAFRKEDDNAPDVYDTQVKYPFYPKKMSFRSALRLAIGKIPTWNGTFLIRDGVIEVTTLRAASIEALLDSKVQAAFDKQPLVQVLANLSNQTGASIVLDPRLAEVGKKPVTAFLRGDVSLAGALTMFSDMVDAKWVALDAAIYITSPERAATLRPMKHVRKATIRGTFGAQELAIVLAELSQKTGVNIVVDPRLGDKAKKNVMVFFREEVTLETALTILADMADVEWVTLNGTIYVTSPDRAGALRGEKKREATKGKSVETPKDSAVPPPPKRDGPSKQSQAEPVRTRPLDQENSAALRFYRAAVARPETVGARRWYKTIYGER